MMCRSETQLPARRPSKRAQPKQSPRSSIHVSQNPVGKPSRQALTTAKDSLTSVVSQTVAANFDKSSTMKIEGEIGKKDLTLEVGPSKNGPAAKLLIESAKKILAKVTALNTGLSPSRTGK